MRRNEKIDAGSAFDWGRASKDYAKFRDIYPSEFYQKIIDLGLCTKGQKVLDMGTGTGVLPRNLYRFGAKFTGTDISADQIEEARRISQEKGMDIEYAVSSAEDVDFPANSFDVITACQCHIYFDNKIVLPKIHEMLKENGHYCMMWMAWLPDEDRIAQASENLVLAYNPSWTGAGSKRTELNIPEWAHMLFTVRNSILYDVKIPFTRESWHGRIKACRGIGASSLSGEIISEFEREHTELLNSFPETFEILHFVAILDLVKDVW
ncbi:MAG: class I SAM-dependent methyltransferase [Clostridiales bacterium]|nr:class I SAM-dependent methyltransferase [Clostridiales bacterium]